MLTANSQGNKAQKRWYVVYTRPRSEKKVYELLVEQNIEAFLPLQKTLRQWSDRKKTVEIPLFSSYVFVHISAKEYLSVLQTFGVVRYITFEGKAVAIPQSQIDNLKILVNSDADIETYSRPFKIGQRVTVTMGALKGLNGELIRDGKHNRVLVHVDHLEQNLLVNVPQIYLEYL